MEKRRRQLRTCRALQALLGAIFAEIGEAVLGRKFLDVTQRQYGIPAVVAPRLYRGLEYPGNEDSPGRWFPLANNRRVVIDPGISFGQPTVVPEAVPTVVLAKAVAAGQNVANVAKWYRVSPHSVRKAVEYERQLAA